MTEKILYRVLCDEYEEVARIFFEVTETGEQIEGSHQIQKWINNVFNENEQLKKDCSNLIDDNTEYVAEINQMHKQNGQLKKELESFKPIIFESDGKPVTLYKKGDVE